MVIPKGKILYINVNRENITGDVDMVIETDITFPVSSDFQPLLGGGNTKLLDLIGGLSKELTGKGYTGQFKAMGVQVWNGTAPLTISLTVGFYMDKTKPDAYKQVYRPSIQLTRLTLPEEQALGNLIAPGPTILSALSGEKKGEGGKVLSMQIGKMLRIDSIIVKKAEPTFSIETDSYGYPIWSKVSIEISSVNTATTKMFPLYDDGRLASNRRSESVRERNM